MCANIGHLLDNARIAGGRNAIQDSCLIELDFDLKGAIGCKKDLLI